MAKHLAWEGDDHPVAAKWRRSMRFAWLCTLTFVTAALAAQDRDIRGTVIGPAGPIAGVVIQTTTTMPGFILEEGTTSTLAYTYDAQKLAKDFPNLDLHDADGFAGVDTITISFLLSGTDSAGTRKHFARQIVIQGEELQMPEQKETIVPSRRRGVRR